MRARPARISVGARFGQPRLNEFRVRRRPSTRTRRVTRPSRSVPPRAPLCAAGLSFQAAIYLYTALLPHDIAVLSIPCTPAPAVRRQARSGRHQGRHHNGARRFLCVEFPSRCCMGGSLVLMAHVCHHLLDDLVRTCSHTRKRCGKIGDVDRAKASALQRAPPGGTSCSSRSSRASSSTRFTSFVIAWLMHTATWRNDASSLVLSAVFPEPRLTSVDRPQWCHGVLTTRALHTEIERFKFDGFPGEWEQVRPVAPLVCSSVSSTHLLRSAQRRGGKYVWKYFHFIEWLQRQSPEKLSPPQASVVACLEVRPTPRASPRLVGDDLNTSSNPTTRI